MTTYTVFEHTAVDEPIGRQLTLERAFMLVCEAAKFAPRFRSETGGLVLEFTDLSGIGREHEPFRNAHPVPARARRELMEEAIGKGIWGFHASTDARWDKEMRAAVTADEGNVHDLGREMTPSQFHAATGGLTWGGKRTLPAAQLPEGGNVTRLVSNDHDR